MNKLSFLFCVLVLIVSFTLGNASDFVPGQIMIDLKHEYLPIIPAPNGGGVIVTGIPSIDSLNILYGIYAIVPPVNQSFEVSRGFYLLKFPDSLNLEQVLSSYLADIHINMGSLNCIRQPHVTPVDDYFSEQWGLKKMKCPEAWRYTSGTSSTTIQIIDGGTDYGHPDLVRNIWENSAQQPNGEDADGDGHTIEWDPAQNKWVLDPGDLNGIDNDNNGYCDDLVGFDFRDDPCEQGNGYGYDPQPEYSALPWEWRDHGDMTAGTAAAVTDNWISSNEAQWVCWFNTGTVAGTSWFSKIMIARIWDDWDAILAVDYGISKGAKIISMSWGYPYDNPQLHAKLDAAWNAGLLLIASAGNDSSEAFVYPAAYPNVIAVAGTESTDVKAGRSCWGTWVDICAPYRNVAPDRDNPPRWSYYCYNNNFAGTSASAPFVAGVAAMVWSCNPSATNVQVKNAILSTTDNIYNIPGNYPYIGKLGSGRVNALNAVKVFRPVAPPPGDCNSNIVVDVGDVVYLIHYLYQSGLPPDPFCVGDVNGSGTVEAGDITYLISYLYRGGPLPQDGCY